MNGKLLIPFLLLFPPEKTSSASGFPEDFEALFKNSEEWRLNAECLKKYITEKTNEGINIGINTYLDRNGMIS